MKNRLIRPAIATALLGFVLSALPAGARQADLGISVSDGRIRDFYLAVGSHYRVAPRVVVDYRTRYRLHDEELPVVFFLAARARVSPGVVIDLRTGKRSWLDIAVHLGLSPEIFFVHIGRERIGPPYGNAYGYYRKYGRAGDWRKLSLADREVVDLVNLRFLSEYHGIAPDAIMDMRGRGRDFIGIHEEAGRGKRKSPQAGESKGSKPAKGKNIKNKTK